MAIGTHDLDTIQGPFYFNAKPPSEIVFQALNQTETMDANKMMDFYSVLLLKFHKNVYVIKSKFTFSLL